MSNANVVKINVGQVIIDRLPVLSRFIPKHIVICIENVIRQKELNGLLADNA